MLPKSCSRQKQPSGRAEAPRDRREVVESEAALQREGFCAVGEVPFGVQEPPAVARLHAVGGAHCGWDWGGPGEVGMMCWTDGSAEGAYLVNMCQLVVSGGFW